MIFVKRPFFTVGFAFFAGNLLALLFSKLIPLWAAITLLIAAAVCGALCKVLEGGAVFKNTTAALFSFSAGILAAILSTAVFIYPLSDFSDKQINFSAKVIGNVEYNDGYTVVPVKADLNWKNIIEDEKSTDPQFSDKTDNQTDNSTNSTKGTSGTYSNSITNGTGVDNIGTDTNGANVTGSDNVSADAHNDNGEISGNDNIAGTGGGNAVNADNSDSSDSLSATIILRVKKPINTSPGDRVDCIATLSDPLAASDGQQFLSPVYLSGDCSSITVTGKGTKDLLCAAQICKKAIVDSVFSVFSDDVAGLMTGISLSFTDQTPYYITRALRICSLSHLTSVSGLHITLLAGIIAFFLSKLKGRKLSGILSLFLIWAFVFISGMRLPAIRAALMMTVMIAGKFFLRRADSLNSLGLSCLLICMFIPFSAGDVGFICSVLATLGIVTLATPIGNFFSKHLKNKRFLRRLIPITDLVSITLSSMVFSLPILVYCFGSFSFISVISNILVTPFAVVCVVGCIFGGALSLLPVIGFIGYPLLLCGGAVAKYFIWITGLLSKIPFASVYTRYEAIYVFLVIFYLVLLLAFIKRRNDKVLKKRTVALVSIIISCSLAVCCAAAAVVDGSTYALYSCGRENNTALLIIHQNKAIIIGCDKKPSVNYEMLSIMRNSGIESPELFIPLKDSSPLGAYYITSSCSPKAVAVADNKQYLSLLLKPARSPILTLSDLLNGSLQGADDLGDLSNLGNLSFSFDPSLSGAAINMNGQRIFAGDKTAASGNYDFIISQGEFIFSDGSVYKAEGARIKTVFSKTTVRRFDQWPK